MMADLPTPPDGFVFVDFGSGKGKVLLLAARYPFRRIVGVEVSPDLHRAALENVRRHASTAAGLPPIECLSMDAASFAIPDEPAVFYFFDPFPEEVLASVLQNIQRSLDRLQRPVFLLFYSPARRGAPWDRRRLCDEAPFLRLVRDEATYGVYAGG
jgi:SAM-dependent methyltransferase